MCGTLWIGRVHNTLPDTGTDGGIFSPWKLVRWSILTTTHHF
jgi:hypothetical protein